MALVLLQPLVFLLQPPKAAPVVPHSPASHGRLCYAEASPPPTIPTAGQALQRRQPHTAAEPVNPRTPLRAGFHCRVFPGSVSSASSSSIALVLSARRGQRGQGTTSIGRVLYVERLTAGSIAATRKFLLITRKIIIPTPDSRDPPKGPPYFAKKHFPLTAATHRTGHRISRKKRSPRCQLGPTGSASLLCTKK